jgi:hypothetical protein
LEPVVNIKLLSYGFQQLEATRHSNVTDREEKHITLNLQKKK